MNTSAEIIEAIRKGEMVILVDDEDRENEGDLIIAADFADAKAVNFMAMHGRGLICLALAPDMIDRLGLQPMHARNRTRHETAFMVSIEAREGISTGISAADRAKTIAVAIDEKSTGADIASPGHVFPLSAKKGGVLVRAGHTEAAVDLAQLAGMRGAGAICEIMNEDGTMARLPDLKVFALKHGLKLGTIADLIEYRRRREKLIEKIWSGPYHSPHAGDFEMRIYRALGQDGEHIALIKNPQRLPQPCLARVQMLNVVRDVLADTRFSSDPSIFSALKKMQDAGAGVMVLLAQNPSAALVEQQAQDKTLREYGIGAQILQDCGACDITLLTNNPRALPALQGYGLKIQGIAPFHDDKKKECMA
jgi:3,4-dihydroxy 2-butanone 4-phosphate synthase/GTP cyclohydrolase II